MLPEARASTWTLAAVAVAAWTGTVPLGGGEQPPGPFQDVSKRDPPGAARVVAMLQKLRELRPGHGAALRGKWESLVSEALDLERAVRPSRGSEGDGGGAEPWTLHRLAARIDALERAAASPPPETARGHSAIAGVPAPSRTGAAAANQSPASGSVAGTVTDASTGLPIEDVWVSVYEDAFHDVRTAFTDAEGHYLADFIPSGTYYVKTQYSPGYLDELWQEMPCPGRNGCDPTTGTPVTVGTGVTEGIDFTLEPGGTIEGVLTDAVTGLPIDGYLSIYRADGTLYCNGDPMGGGQYVSDIGLATGTYYLRSHRYGGYLAELYDDIDCWFLNCPPWLGTPVEVIAPQATKGIDLALLPGGEISGTVTHAETGEPIPGIQVSVGVLHGPGGGIALTTDAAGAFRASNLVPSLYAVRTYNGEGLIDEIYDDVPCTPDCDVTAAVVLPVTPGSVYTGIDMELAPGGQLAGSISDATTGAPLDWAGVYVFDAAGRRYGTGIADSSGQYASRGGLVPGTYYVQTWNGEGYLEELWNDVPCSAGQCDPTSGTPIVVKGPGTIPGVDFALEPGGRVAGHMTDAGSGEPIYACVSISDDTAVRRTWGCPDSSGDYLTYTGLPPGEYYATTFNWTGYLEELFPDIPCPGGFCDPASGFPIWISGAETVPGIDFALDPGGRIAGTITDDETGFWIHRCVDVFDTTGRLFTTGCTNSDGTYDSDSGLPTGDYFARSRSVDPEGYLDELYDDIPCPGGACDPTTGTPISTVEGTVIEGIDFALAPDRSLFADGFESGDTSAWSSAAF